MACFARGKHNTLTACSAALPSYSPSFQKKTPHSWPPGYRKLLIWLVARTLCDEQRNKKARTDGPMRHRSWLAILPVERHWDCDARPQSDPGNQENNCLSESITFGIVFHFSLRPRCAFSKEPSLDLQFSSRSSENVRRVIKRRQKHTHALAKYDGGARHKQATVRFLSFFVLHKPSINSHSDHASPRPTVASTEMFMKFASPNFGFQTLSCNYHRPTCCFPTQS